MPQEISYIGYWNNSAGHYPEHPLPVENSGTFQDVQEALSILAKIKASPRVTTLIAKGSSPCRLCKTLNGSLEFEICIRNKRKEIVKRVRIPEGYSHYLTAHKVAPDIAALRELLDHI